MRGKLVPTEHLAADAHGRRTHRRDAGDELARRAAAGARDGAGRRIADGAGPRHVHRPALRAALPVVGGRSPRPTSSTSTVKVSRPAFLARMADRLDEHGWSMRAAVENEFSLARDGEDGIVPIDSSLCFSTVGMNAAAEVIDVIRRPRSTRRASPSSSTTRSWGTASTRSPPGTRRSGRRPTVRCSCARRSGVSQPASVWSRRSLPSRGPTRPATAPTCTGASGTGTAMSSTIRAAASGSPPPPSTSWPGSSRTSQGCSH